MHGNDGHPIVGMSQDNVTAALTIKEKALLLQGPDKFLRRHDRQLRHTLFVEFLIVVQSSLQTPS